MSHPAVRPFDSRLVVYLWFAFAINYVDRQMVYSMFPALEKELGFAGAQLGLIGSLFMWVYTLAMPAAGRAADQWPRHRLVLASLLLWSLATVGCGTATSQNSFLFWRGAMGLTEALYYPAAMALIAAYYPAQARSRALGLHQSAMYVGVLVGGWYGGWAADNLGWRYGFLSAALVGIGYAALLWHGLGRLVLDTPLRPVAQPLRPTAQPASWTAIFASPCFVALCLAFSAFCAMQWVVLAWYPSYLQKNFQLSMTDSGWNATLFVQVSQVVGILAGGAWADWLCRKWPAARLYVAALGVMGSAPFAYATFSAGSLPEARLYSAGFGLFSGLLAANAFAAGFDVVGAAQRGLAGGLLNMMGGLSSAAMIYLAGLWRDSLGFSALTGWMTLVSVSTGALLLWVARGHFPARPLAVAPPLPAE